MDWKLDLVCNYGKQPQGEIFTCTSRKVDKYLEIMNENWIIVVYGTS